jgi:hypothetical protein
MTYPVCILIGFVLVTAVYFIVRVIVRKKSPEIANPGVRRPDRCQSDFPKPLSCIDSVC